MTLGQLFGKLFKLKLHLDRPNYKYFALLTFNYFSKFNELHRNYGHLQ